LLDFVGKSNFSCQRTLLNKPTITGCLVDNCR
jgi:hypothetical protein